MAQAPYSSRFTQLLLEGLACYRRGELEPAMTAWEAAYHVEAGNLIAREFLRTALLRINVQLGHDAGRPHPWLSDAPAAPEADAPAPAPAVQPPPPPPQAVFVGEASPWDHGPSLALEVEPQPSPVPVPKPASTRPLPRPPSPRKPLPQAAGAPARAKTAPSGPGATPSPPSTSRSPGSGSARPIPPPPARHGPSTPIGAMRPTQQLRPRPPGVADEQAGPPSLPTPIHGSRLATPAATPKLPFEQDPSGSGHPSLAAARDALGSEVERVEQGRSPKDVAALLHDARTRLSARDFGGALELTAQVLARGGDQPEAQAIEAACERGLTELYEHGLGGLRGQPQLILPPENVRSLKLDASSGFVLSQIDGNLTYEELFDVCGLPRLETARILARLVKDGVIKGGS